MAIAATLLALPGPLDAHTAVVSRKSAPSAAPNTGPVYRPEQTDTVGAGPVIAKPVSVSPVAVNTGPNAGSGVAPPAPPAPSAAPYAPPPPSGSQGSVRGTHNANLAGAAAAARALREEGDTQTAFSTPPPPPPPRNISPPPEWLTNLFGWLGGSGNWFVTSLAWLGIGIVALGILYLAVPVVREFIDGFINRKRKIPGEDDASPSWQPDQAGARNLLAEADALANSGRYAEAVHLLLGRSLEDIANRRPGLLKPALTARAIAVMGELPAQARTAFGQIAAAVERSLWARHDLALADWQSARASYEEFAFGSHWRGAGT